jgi:CRISPR-associated protein Csd1
MILQSLIRLAERERLLPPPGFWREDVSWVVVVTADGQVLRVDGPEVRTIPAEGKKKAKVEELSRWVWAPAVDMNNPGVTADSIIAKAERLFGWIEEAKHSEKAVKDAVSRRASQLELIRAIGTRCPDDVGMLAWLAALGRIAADPLCLAGAPGMTEHSQRKPATYRCCLTDCSFSMAQVLSERFAFRLDGDGDLIVQRPAVREAIAAWAAERDAKLDRGECILSGQVGPLSDKHPQVLLFPGSWVSLISCSDEHKAFAHYGRDNLDNAPVHLTTARQLAIATARLISDGDFVPPGASQPLPKRHLRLPGDTVVLYWCEVGAEGDPLDDPWMAALVDPTRADPNQAAACYTQPWRGTGRDLCDLDQTFHTLVLGPNNKRVVLRGASTRTIGSVAASVRRWQDDLAIVPRYPNERIGLRDLIQSTVSAKAKKRPDPAPDLAAQLYLCAIEADRKPPASLLSVVLGRIRSHDGNADTNDLTVSTARVALIKLILIRRYDRKVPMSLDPDHPSTSYHLGRLFCLLERIQGEALDDVNASIADRFLGSAMATPSMVFPRLMKLSHHHLRKLSGKNSGRAVNLDKLKDQILGRFQTLPRILQLEDQGMFIIGYHHQRAEFFRKKDQSATTDLISDPAGIP